MDNIDKAIETFVEAKEAYSLAEFEMVLAFNGYKDFLKTGDYEGAREYLRAMPECSSKVLCFRHIILAEEMR